VRADAARRNQMVCPVKIRKQSVTDLNSCGFPPNAQKCAVRIKANSSLKGANID
jgi:hypothetical protein